MAPSESIQNDFATGSLVYISVFSTILVMSFVIMCIKVYAIGQKTRNTQQRRAYVGSRSQSSIPVSEPPIYVSPANLPPPPKYELMAPPSYEEVVGIHYPAYQPPGQPINQPITAALAAQSNTSTNASNEAVASNESNATSNVTTTITTIDERRPVAASS